MKVEQSPHFSDSVKVWIDGSNVSPEGATVSVFDRGFLYGDSVFETLRTYQGRVFALDEHVARLSESATRVFIDLPVSLDALKTEIERAVALSGFSECYVRVMVTRGSGAMGLDPRLAGAPLRVLLVAQLIPPPFSDYRDGIAAVTFQTARPHDSTEAAGAKIGNYLVAVLAQKKAAESGAKEALILNAAGQVIEGATSNVFWIEGAILWTVPEEAGILAGITRAHLLTVAQEMGLAIRFAIPSVERVFSADAVFVSSSIREMLSIVSIDGRPIGSGKVHPCVCEIHGAFRRACGVEPIA